ncbi:TatD family hydrolase [Marilutibacter spongiae]|uniref:TatD family hydrolase n=1 Tax=Marilutibacter spongiae TaxID=2025720 RepID=A0A7W3TK67_9GAMM|nr:TatD family hydrolase [Lysobacter spongiae]MBB1059434.1 TatD family hydrolase [Lysobacter spongiae]
MVDSHCHLDAPRFDADRDAVIARARAAGVTRQVVPAVTAASWSGLRDACRRAPGLYPAYGLHPMFMDAHEPADLERLARWLQTEQAVAVGECGLDFFVDGFDADAQSFYFDGQLRLARDLDLPLIIHARKAVDAAMAAIRRFAPLRGVVHSFSGSLDQARRLHDMGFLIGLGGPVTHERARRLRRVAAEVDIDSLLVETDAPDQPDAGIRGERNEPARLPYVVEAIARLRGMAPEALADATARNAERLFGLPPA